MGIGPQNLGAMGVKSSTSPLNKKDPKQSYADATGFEEVHFVDGKEIKGPRPGKFKPVDMGGFDVKSKSTLSQKSKSKNGKTKSEKEDFESKSVSRKHGAEDEADKLTMKSKTNKGKTKSKVKFKAVKDGKVLKSVQRNGRTVRESERKITKKAQARKAKRYYNSL